MTSHFVGT